MLENNINIIGKLTQKTLTQFVSKFFFQ